MDEKPVLKEIIITGNDKFRTKALMKEIGLEVGQVLDNKLLKEGINNIELKYRKKGYRFVFIKDEVSIDEDKKEVIVTITINEGDKFKIESIDFEGNETFSDKELRKVMRTKADSLFTSGAFDEHIFDDDVDRIKLFYQKEGFLDAEVEPIVNYDNEESAIFIKIVVHEGLKYLAGEVKVQGNKLFPSVEITERFEMLPGTTYSPVRLGSDVNQIMKYYFERGHIEASVEPEMKFDKDSGKVDVVYNISEGDVFEVDKIRIRGNTKTRDIVIRRELRIYPGEVFDGNKLDRSTQRLKNLGFFEDVSFGVEPGTSPNKRDLVFKVKEKQTGEFSFGGGISSLETFLGFIELKQTNFDITNWPTFTGDGQQLSIRGRWGEVSRDVDISFVEPYIFDLPYSLGVRIYNWEEDVSTLDFSTVRLGGGLTLGKEFTDYLSAALSYDLQHVDLKDLEPDAHSDITNTLDGAFLSRMKLSMTYDKRDNRFVPSSGYFVGASAELVGGFLGGDEDFYNLQMRYSKYWSPIKEHVIEFRQRFGFMNEYGGSDAVPVYDRFYAGGLGSVRGYNYRRVGPKGNGNPIGGESLFLTSLEYTFPLIENFKGAFFIDMGHVNKKVYSFDPDDLSVSVGPGVLINTPIGPIVFYYGYPVHNEDDKDKNGRLEFSFSRGF